ncbi:NmrA-like family protein [Aspergillus parasiticus SU-1]|uniref:NmrA-like family protein n=1 Tax=Aspergillus parasiticus (strain ATCC 56775 / NRRL 5862 / SRRC 143 / SU-1) TaxID=1403190 RepID=A0A0F0IBU7_ASPPU|nr:NmrA-like family protein [Aspergillus parasiticus SU-1]
MATVQEEIKYITVLGATGNQGGGVVRALLAKTEPSFHVRAITRDVSSTAAQSLQEKYKDSGRLELVAADVYNKQSLIEAFKNVYGVFAVTNNRITGKKIEKEQDMDHELEAGRNIIDAAKVCLFSVYLYQILSTINYGKKERLPNITNASKGRFTKVFHFDNKHKIEQWARDELPAVTALHPGLFYTNMQWSQYCQRQDDGTVRFCAPIDGDKLADWVDPSYDIGVYAAEIFSLGPEKTASKTYPVVGPKLSFADFARVFREITSQEATFDPITLDQWGATVAATVGKGYEEDIKQMMEWIAVAPDDKICYGTMDHTDDTSYEDLGVKASTLADWMRRTAWQGPQ